jgi:hypothetical protein
MPEGSIFGCVYCRIPSSRVTCFDAKSLQSKQFVQVEPKVMYSKKIIYQILRDILFPTNVNLKNA